MPHISELTSGCSCAEHDDNTRCVCANGITGHLKPDSDESLGKFDRTVTSKRHLEHPSLEKSMGMSGWEILKKGSVCLYT